MRRGAVAGFASTWVVLAVLALPAIAADEAPSAPGDAAGSTDEPAPAPRIEFATLAHDFGSADSGAQLETTFTFRNAGSSQLVIENVKGG